MDPILTCDVCGATSTRLVIPGQQDTLVLPHSMDCIRGAGSWSIEVDDVKKRIQTLAVLEEKSL